MSVTKEQVVDAARRLKLDTIYFLKGTLTEAQPSVRDA